MLQFNSRVTVEFIGYNAVQTRRYISREKFNSWMNYGKLQPAELKQIDPSHPYYEYHKNKDKYKELFAYGSIIEGSPVGKLIEHGTIGQINSSVYNYSNMEVKLLKVENDTD